MYAKLLLLCVLLALAACKAEQGIITKQYYEPAQTVQYLNEAGTGGRIIRDDADYCLEVAPVNAAYYRMRRQAIPMAKLYLDFDRWKAHRVGDTISYRRAHRRD